ncbi:MAG: tetraacyldisaccharide 4'-kinase [Alphaproteobacteria bacterium]|nr:tetraacyldisaccharide 4'-kinase [Alphaproteobacteria bacterium]
MRAPDFWHARGPASLALAPLGWLYALGGAARRSLVDPWRAGVPVLCVGNLTLGGTGKTPLVAEIARRLAARGGRPAILSRGYGGAAKGPLRVDPGRNTAADVGDEPLLLAAEAPVFVGTDRVASAKEAVASGADRLIMDDGFQNPSLHKDRAIIVVDGPAGFGNGRVFPAGPLREPVSWGAARAAACVVIGEDAHGAAASTGLPVLRADLLAQPNDLAGADVLAFAGIGRPGKFFATLEEVGARVRAVRQFDDHHPYSRAEIEALLAEADRLGARAVTTRKDLVRVDPDLRLRLSVLDVRLVFADEAAFDAQLDFGRA